MYLYTFVTYLTIQRLKMLLSINDFSFLYMNHKSKYVGPTNRQFCFVQHEPMYRVDITNPFDDKMLIPQVRFFDVDAVKTNCIGRKRATMITEGSVAWRGEKRLHKVNIVYYLWLEGISSI